MLWVLLVICVVAALGAAGWYVRKTAGQQTPLYGASVGLVAVGVVTADLPSLFDVGSLQHEMGLAGTLLAVAGLVLLTREITSSWKHIACDTALIGLGPPLSVYTVLLLTLDIPNDANQNLDVITACIVCWSAVLIVNLAMLAEVPARRDRALCATYGVTRAVLWMLLAAESSDLFAVPAWVQMAVATLGIVAVTAYLARLSRFRIQPVVNPIERGSGAVPHAMVVAATGVVLAGIIADPDVARRSLVVPGALAIAAMLARLILIVRDASRAAAHAEARELYYRTLVQDSSDVIMISTPEGRLEYVSPAAEHVLGDGDLTGATLWDALSIPASRVEESLARAGDGDHVVLEGRHGDRAIEASISARGDQLVVSARDVTERDQLRQRLHRLAYHDPLTDLPNRLQLLEAVGTMLDEFAAGGPPVSVLFVDLDRFKHINDASGHAVGDAVLQQVADRLRSRARGRMLARLGGDEFVVVHCGDPDEAQALAEEVTAALTKPFHVDGRAYQIGASTGIALASPTTTSHEMLRRADLAMYQAKRGRGGWALYEHGLVEAAAARVDAEGEVAHALRQGRLHMYLQPLVSTSTLGVLGCEALLRWRRRDGSVVGPLPMLQFAEQTHQLGTLTGRMLREAVSRLATTPGNGSIAVNVPASVLVEPGLPAEIARTLDVAGVDPSRLEIEITEEAMVAQGARSLEAVNALRAYGVRLVIDDFGTGYSSLSYLTRFPVDGVKIDRSFISEIGSSTAARSVVRGLVGVTRELGVHLVAEGVETQDQHNWLLELGVPIAQGYWYARPQDAATVHRLTSLSEWSSAGDAAAV
ncbi:MAG: EAL domain-containing protein [Thermoleophilia bacterium]|nr:EAL domain-containing protein [Thermoleophilia bacterium]